MAVGDAYVFPGFLTPVLTQLFFPKPLTTFLTCFCRGERRKYTRKKVRLNQGSNSQPPRTKLKAFADNKMKMVDMMIFVSGRVENIVGQEESAGKQRFSPFPSIFQFLP